MLLAFWTLSLVPLLLCAIGYYGSMEHLGTALSQRFGGALMLDARRTLEDLTGDYERTLEAQKRALELALRWQVREVEAWLKTQDSAHFRMALVPGSGRFESAASPGREALGPWENHPALDRVLRSIRAELPGLILSQHLVFSDGLRLQVPVGLERDGLDWRQLGWFERARGSARPVWWALPRREGEGVRLVTALPFSGPDGAFAGVTAIEVPFEASVRDLRLPAHWTQGGLVSLVWYEQPGEGEKKVLEIALRVRSGSQGDWEVPQKPALVFSEDEREMEALLDDVASGRRGLRSMSYAGRPALWAWGAREGKAPFFLMVVPQEALLQTAAEASREVGILTRRGLMLTGVLILTVFFAAGLGSVFMARRLTRPVAEMEAAARQLADGDFDSRVEICTGDELQRLGEMFNTLGPSLRERQSMKQALELAGQVQRFLLPAVAPRVEGLDIFGSSRYCDETGGDYFDFLVLGDGARMQLAVAVGDVSGHGIGAALLMASVRALFHSACEAGRLDLADTLCDINAYLARDSSDAQFMTFFCALIDPGRRSLRWNSAGQGPVYLFRRQGTEVCELETTGPPLGMIEGLDYPPGGPVDLEPEDLLLIGTDGIWETLDRQGLMYGTQRLREVVGFCIGQSASEIHQKVMASVEAFSGGAPPDDDRTLVVIRVLPG